MISKVRVAGFKRFANASFDFAPLTVLTGLNGSGKTSLIHALLLARQAWRAGDAVTLRGGGFELGTAGQMRNWNAGDAIEIDLSDTDGATRRWKLGVPSEGALHLNVIEAPGTQPLCFQARVRGFTYLCAERFGPRETLGSSPVPPDRLEVGAHGEYVAQLLYAVGNRSLEFPARARDGEPQLLKYEVERWLASIARPVELDVTVLDGTSVTRLRYRAEGGEWVSAPNMGFGVTYSLPIVLAGLIAIDGGLLIVENPEAHLHPAGQSHVGAFLAFLAKAGVQVLVETHSDHVVNGIRRAIGERSFGIDHTLAMVHFFSHDPDGAPRFEQLRFTPTGGVSDWPKGFFDQYQLDTAALGRVRRQR